MAETSTNHMERTLLDRQREHLFFVGMAAVMLLIVLMGFGRSFFFAFLWTEPAPDASRDFVYYIHGTFAAAWMVFAVVQPLLIKGRNVRLHRRIGWIAALTACAVLATGTYAAIASAARDAQAPLPATPLDFLGVIVSGIIMYGVFVGLGILNRTNSATHKRLMYLATINLLQAAIVRIPIPFLYFSGPWVSYPVSYTVILPLVIWDVRTQGKIHTATLWGGAAIILSLPVRIWLSETPTWLAIAAWSVRIVSD